MIPKNIHTNNTNLPSIIDVEKRGTGDDSRPLQSSSHSLKNGFLVILFVVIAFLTSVSVAVCVTRSYVNYRKTLTPPTPVKPCNGHLTFHTMMVGNVPNSDAIEFGPSLPFPPAPPLPIPLQVHLLNDTKRVEENEIKNTDILLENLLPMIHNKQE